jgi:ankyrin repeat protein
LTPLHLAALNGREDVVRFLLSKNALINAEDAEENTPLHSAARGGHLGVVNLLLAAAAVSGSPVAVFIGAKNKLGLTPGASALLHGHIDIANTLVAKGWDPYHIGPEQFSLLHLTAAVGRSESVSWLLENGAGDVDDADNLDKVTPLHCAAVSGDIDTCQVLLDARADVDFVDRKNQRPFDLIGTTSSDDIVNELKELLKPSSGVTSSSTSTISIASKATTSSKSPPPTLLSSASSSRHAAFLSLSQPDQIRRARTWTSFHPTELQETLETYPGAEEAIRRVKMATELKKTIEIMRAMASLRCDEEFQKDISQPSVYQAVMELRKNPSLYDSFAHDLKFKSVVAKMGRIHAVVQANGQRTFSIEELIVPVAQIKVREGQDKERILAATYAMECQLAGAAAAAAVTNKKNAIKMAEEAVNKLKKEQWKKAAAAVGPQEIEEVVDTRVWRKKTTTTSSKEAVWRQAEREMSIFDQAIAEAIEVEEDTREERNWRLLMFLGIVLILWSLSLMYRWGLFSRPKWVLQDIGIEVDGDKLDL